MLDKPGKDKDSALTTIEGKDLAIGIQFSCAYEGNRTLMLTTGVPLDITQEGLEKVIGRLSKASESLDNVYRLRGLREQLKRWMLDHETAKQQRANQEVMVAHNWQARNRKGDPRPTATEEAQTRNFDISIQRCADEIRRVREEIAKLEGLAGDA